MATIDHVRIAVLIPCYNEEVAVARVVHDFREALPKARIYVFDNNSTDATRGNALAAGAIVRHVARPGKGNVVRRMFADVENETVLGLQVAGPSGRRSGQ